MTNKPCYKNKDSYSEVSTNEVEELKGKDVEKDFFANVSKKMNLLIGEIKNTSEGIKDADYSKSFSDVFKFNLKCNSIPLLNNSLILKKLNDFADDYYLKRFIRDLIIMGIFKWCLNTLFSNGIAIYDLTININPYIYIIGLILALFCGAMTGILYHSYRELPNKIAFGYKVVLNSMLVSTIFGVIFRFIGTKPFIGFILLIIIEYLFVLTVFTAVTTIYNKLVYLYR